MRTLSLFALYVDKNKLWFSIQEQNAKVKSEMASKQKDLKLSIFSFIMITRVWYM